MSAAPSSRPPVPRPSTIRKASAPPAAPAVAKAAPERAPESAPAPAPTPAAAPAAAPAPSSISQAPVSSVRAIPAAYASEPPVIRDVPPNLELELADDDIVEAAPVPLTRRTSPPPPPPSSRRSSARAEPPSQRETPVVAVPARGSVPDPTEVLFEGIYELDFVETSWQAADVCAVALAKALGARAVIVHAHDLARREIRAIGAFGPRSHEVLGSFEPSEDDFVASAAICNAKPVTMKFDGELPRLAPSRLTIVGAARSLVAVPVLAWGRCVALIEVVDADEMFAARVVDAVAYAADRLAEFLSARAAA